LQKYIHNIECTCTKGSVFKKLLLPYFSIGTFLCHISFDTLGLMIMPALLNQLPPPPPGKTGWPWTVESTRLPQEQSSGQPWPKISIVTPSFNQGAYLEETIRSVLLQGYPSLEYIIIDGGSTDNSVEIIKKYEPWLTYWVSEPDSGQSFAINRGFAASRGVLLTWLNSDDYLLPDALYIVAELYQPHLHASVFVGGGLLVNEYGGNPHCKVAAEDLSPESLLTWLDDFHFIQPSCFFTRDVWNSCGPLDETLHFAMDLDLWLKLSKCCGFTRTDAILSCARIHDSAKTTKFTNMSLIDSCLVLIKHGGAAQARKHLDLMAARLSWHEYYLGLATGSPLYRLFRGLIRKVLRTDEKWCEMTPSWPDLGDGEKR